MLLNLISSLLGVHNTGSVIHFSSRVGEEAALLGGVVPGLQSTRPRFRPAASSFRAATGFPVHGETAEQGETDEVSPNHAVFLPATVKAGHVDVCVSPSADTELPTGSNLVLLDL